MLEPEADRPYDHPCTCCPCGHQEPSEASDVTSPVWHGLLVGRAGHREPGEAADVTRRAFLAATGMATAAGLAAPALAAMAANPNRPRPTPIRVPLVVQPVFNCHVYERSPSAARSSTCG